MKRRGSGSRTRRRADGRPDRGDVAGVDDDGPVDRAGRLRRRSLSAYNWMFRDRHTGRITIAQLPNAPLGIFLATVVAGRATDEDDLTGLAVRWTGSIALGWWALAELRSGANPWRRLLGLLGCAAVGVRTVRLLG